MMVFYVKIIVLSGSVSEKIFCRDFQMRSTATLRSDERTCCCENTGICGKLSGDYIYAQQA